MVDVVLTGCRPEPLASYLKALGVLRLVAEQKDPEAQGFWQGEHFVLRSSLTAEALETFLVEEWKPTPLVARPRPGSQTARITLINEGRRCDSGGTGRRSGTTSNNAATGSSAVVHAIAKKP